LVEFYFAEPEIFFHYFLAKAFIMLIVFRP